MTKDSVEIEASEILSKLKHYGEISQDLDSAKKEKIVKAAEMLASVISDATEASKSETLGENSPVGQSPELSMKTQDKESSSQKLYPSRVILTTYPKQTGVDPIPMVWGAKTVAERGPVVVSRNLGTLKHRNAIGAHGGGYCIYRALAIAGNDLSPNYKPDLTNTEAPYKFGPHPQWFDPGKIVSMDPWGHLIVENFGDMLNNGIDIRPTIAVTKANLKMAELDDAVIKKRLVVDNEIITSDGNVRVVKAAVEPVWYLKEVAKRFNTTESVLRRALFEDTGGMYPELITRPDIELFMPPIGGLTVYIFGDPDKIASADHKLTLRVHDECNGSDVFGSDICTCRPYLIFGIEEAIKQAQSGGVGMIVYFRKEGRALGEVTKYLVYNARKRQEGGDTAETYFKRTECVAGVKDMRFQALMPDVLHWFGIKKIDRFISMSNMKYNAIVNSGIPILERVDIPDELIPDDSQVEIKAKIADGYFSSGTKPTANDLKETKGRSWN